MKSTYRRARRTIGSVRRRIFESPEKIAWRRACEQAEVTPRFTPGTIRMMDYTLRYADLLTLCPQWDDLFVKRTLAFASATPEPYILDCGANIGLASLFYRRLYPGAQITAFEADPAILEILEANLDANGAGSVETRHAALWTETGTIAFDCEGSDSGRIDALAAATSGRATMVPSLRLRDVIAERPVDLLKLDIEGAEDAVLADCEPVLHRVKAMVMDLHEFDPAVRQTPRVLDVLARSGFSYTIDEFAPLPWREPVIGDDTPFPGHAAQWVMTVRAWRR